jgi:VanZ family protein
MRSFAKYQMPLVLYALVIFVLSSFHHLPTPDLGIDWFDKAGHFALYFIFMMLALRALGKPPINLGGVWLYTLTISLSVLYGTSDEFHQAFVPGRSSDLYDLLADTAGIFAAAGVSLVVNRFGHRPPSGPGR